ncbi:MAG: hypothetical protein L6V35_06530 [Alistipes putredinis]|nr:MAG: hypothetical protein L6V35_06530 [Alistipes putredinis]
MNPKPRSVFFYVRIACLSAEAVVTVRGGVQFVQQPFVSLAFVVGAGGYLLAQTFDFVLYIHRFAERLVHFVGQRCGVRHLHLLGQIPDSAV